MVRKSLKKPNQEFAIRHVYSVLLFDYSITSPTSHMPELYFDSLTGGHIHNIN